MPALPIRTRRFRRHANVLPFLGPNPNDFLPIPPLLSFVSFLLNSPAASCSDTTRARLPFVSPVLRSTSTTPPHRPSSGIPFHHTKFNNTAPPHQNQRLHSIVTKLNDTVHHKVQQHHFIVTRFNDSVTSSSSTTSSHRHQVQRLHHTVTKFNDSITLSPHSKIPPHRHQVQTHRLIATKFNGTKLKDIFNSDGFNFH
jgi:hypothetical protein